MKQTVERKAIILARRHADTAVKQAMDTLISMYELRGGGKATTPERVFEYLMTSNDAKTREYAMDTFMALMFHRGEFHALLSAENNFPAQLEQTNPFRPSHYDSDTGRIVELESKGQAMSYEEWLQLKDSSLSSPTVPD